MFKTNTKLLEETCSNIENPNKIGSIFLSCDSSKLLKYALLHLFYRGGTSIAIICGNSSATSAQCVNQMQVSRRAHANVFRVKAKKLMHDVKLHLTRQSTITTGRTKAYVYVDV